MTSYHKLNVLTESGCLFLRYSWQLLLLLTRHYFLVFEIINADQLYFGSSTSGKLMKENLFKPDQHVIEIGSLSMLDPFLLAPFL